MKISVVIPVYNAAEYVTKAVESALDQPQTAEVILIEDGSSDASLAVCQGLASRKPRVRLLRHAHGRNMGAGASRNLGIRNSQYDYVAFLDADDYYLPRRFDIAAEILADSSVDGVYECVALGLLDDHARNTRNNLDGYFITMNKRVDPEELFFCMAPIGDAGFFHLDGFVVRRSTIESTGFFNPGLELSQDTEWLLRLSICGCLKPGAILAPVAIMGLHRGNRSQYADKILAGRPLMYRSLIRWALERGIEERFVAIIVTKLYVDIVRVSRAAPKPLRKFIHLRELLYSWISLPKLLGRPETRKAVLRLVR